MGEEEGGVREEREYKASRVRELKPSTWEMEASLGYTVSFRVRK